MSTLLAVRTTIVLTAIGVDYTLKMWKKYSLWTALGQRLNSLGTALGQPWDGLGTALGQPWDGLGTALGQPWDRLGTAFGQAENITFLVNLENMGNS